MKSAKCRSARRPDSLRVLENGEFIKVGSSKVQKTDVRVIAATNVDLQESINKGKFREDLYYRLSTVPIKVPPLRERGNDVLLLFKKFASDFSENYKTKPVFLEKEAESMIKSYRFPGNIRQLKNIVEQMSVLEMDRAVSTETLLKYLPSPSSNLPALIDKKDEGESYTERDLLYKVLFDMKKDVTEMKRLILQLLTENPSRKDILQEHSSLFSEVHPVNSNHNEKEDEMSAAPILIEGPIDDRDYEDVIEDIVDESAEEDSLSIEKKEKELIIRALKKNNNKRKYAAQDLGISERTLYRKIKQYELED